MAGNIPSHAQSSLPALPAHLQSDTHLTAHLASRYSDIHKISLFLWINGTLTEKLLILDSMSVYQQLVFLPKR